MKTIVLGVINLYIKLFSPLLRNLFGEGCRYRPTCSQYAYASVRRYGVTVGLKRSLVRLSTCHPFSKNI